VIFGTLLLLSACCSLVLTPAVRALAVRWNVLDTPGARKIHQTPIPRIGGVAVAVSAGSALLAISVLHPEVDFGAFRWTGGVLPVVAGGALVFAVGLWDDVRDVPAAIKVLVQALAATLVIGSGITIDGVTMLGTTYGLGALSVAVTFLWIVGLTNAFNLLDGLDGLAAGLAAIASTTCAIILVIRGHQPEALLLVALLGAGVGFLRYNFYPASIFLGDAGSLLFGFVLAVTAITGWQKGATTLAVGVPLLIFAVPILDTLSSIGRRLARRSADAPASLRRPWARLFEPDREHIHHRLIASGLSHPRAVLLLYGLSIGLAGLALLTIQQP